MNILKFMVSDGYRSFARKADWIFAWLSIPFCVIYFWYDWESVGIGPWVSLLCIPLSFAMARYDFTTYLGGRLRNFILWIHFKSATWFM